MNLREYIVQLPNFTAEEADPESGTSADRGQTMSLVSQARLFLTHRALK